MKYNNIMTQSEMDLPRFLCGSCGELCSEYTYSEERDVDECNDCKLSNQNNITL